ncbi:MAG TPA: hypothetical protein VI199_04475 [Novosphingobium sp.]
MSVYDPFPDVSGTGLSWSRSDGAGQAVPDTKLTNKKIIGTPPVRQDEAWNKNKRRLQPNAKQNPAGTGATFTPN